MQDQQILPINLQRFIKIPFRVIQLWRHYLNLTPYKTSKCIYLIATYERNGFKSFQKFMHRRKRASVHNCRPIDNNETLKKETKGDLNCGNS